MWKLRFFDSFNEIWQSFNTNLCKFDMNHDKMARLRV